MKLLTNVFGRYTSQPLHQTLIDFKVIYVLALYITGGWCNQLVNKAVSLSHSDASIELVGLYLVNFMALVPMFWKAIYEMRQKHN